MSIAIPVPVRPSASTTEARSATSSPHSSYSESSRYSETVSSAWAPAGVYVPVHRRSASGSSSTAPNSALSSPQSSKLMLPLSHQPEAKPRPRVYSREELLALAPSSLVHASLHPVITPALLAAHPRILRARGDGIARALDMARTPTYIHSTFAHGCRESTTKAYVELQAQSALEPRAEAEPQTARRRDRRRPIPCNVANTVNSKGISTRRIVQNSNLSKQAPRRQLDVTRSWRASQALVA